MEKDVLYYVGQKNGKFGFVCMTFEQILNKLLPKITLLCKINVNPSFVHLSVSIARVEQAEAFITILPD